jgi:tRNA pseudouridine synthase 10
VEELKEAAFDKTYVATVEFASEPAEEKLKSVLSELEGIVEHRTPTRVSHRRADKVRKRKVHRALLNDLSGKTATITVLCDSGLYVKELVSGDGGRTKPSLSESYGVAARVVALDVIDVGGRSNGKVTRDAEKH